MRFLLLFLAPALYGQVPGLVTVPAGVLNCGAVMRSTTTLQTYCYAPGGPPYVTVCNSLKSASGGQSNDCHYCPTPGIATLVNGVLTIPPCPVAESMITWVFATVAGGIAYNYTTDAKTLVPGTLTAVYGAP